MKDYLGALPINVADEQGKRIPQYSTPLDDLTGLSEEEVELAKTSRNGRFFWKNVYGAPVDTSGATANTMNENPEIGSLWKGRVLMQIIAEKTDKPVRKVQCIPGEDVEHARQFTIDKKYQFIFQINQAIAIPREGAEYEVMVRIAAQEFSTGKPAVSEGQFNRYNYRYEGTMVFPYLNVEDIGTIFVYLREKYTLGGWKNIAFYRASVTEFLDPNPVQIKWIEMQPDLAIGEVTETYKAGLVGMRMSIHDETAHGTMEWKSNSFWKGKVPRRPSSIKVRAYIFQCRDLPAADSDGASDPFLTIIDSGKVKKSKVIFDNLNPIFYEAIDLVYEANNEDELPPFIIDCYDLDESVITANTYDFLARAVIRKEECHHTSSEAIAKPKWHKMRYNSKLPPCGEILCSFSIVEDDFPFRKVETVNLAAQVEMKEF
jgi:hypothetical protein